jgi:tetratricopeptide (TPR) repeat protein
LLPPDGPREETGLNRRDRSNILARLSAKGGVSWKFGYFPRFRGSAGVAERFVLCKSPRSQMPKISESSRTRLRKTELDQIEKDLPKVRIGLPGIVWAGLSVFMIMLTILLLLLMDGRNVVHAAEKGRPWSSAIESGDWETVRKLAKAEVDKSPRDAGAQHALGLSLMELRRFDEAEIPLITAESISPGITDYKITLADLYTRRGVPQLASGKLREALDLDPSLVQIHWRLARTLYTL